MHIKNGNSIHLSCEIMYDHYLDKLEFVILLTPYAHITMASVPITIRARPMIAFQLSFSLNTK